MRYLLLSVLVVSLVGILMFSNGEAEAQVPEIFVHTQFIQFIQLTQEQPAQPKLSPNMISLEIFHDKYNYSFGEVIDLKFKVGKYIPNTPIDIRIFRDGKLLNDCIKDNLPDRLIQKGQFQKIFLSESGVGHYRIDNLSGNLNNIGSSNCYRENISSTYEIYAYYGAEWEWICKGNPLKCSVKTVPEDLLGFASTKLNYSNNLSPEANTLVSFLPTKFDIGTNFKFDYEELELKNPADIFARKNLNTWELPSPEINIKNTIGGAGQIYFMKFKDNADALKYQNVISRYLPSTVPYVHHIHEPTYPQKNGFDCKRVDASYYSNYRSEMSCIRENLVLFIRAGEKTPNLLFESIVEKISESNYFSKKTVAAQSEPESQTGGMESEQTQQSKGGGCLIATAAFGSEMAPQVQFLREIRDNTVLQTESGTSFMAGFNQFYYSFSPAIADYERENPAFKEAVKLTLTPLLTSLMLLQYADIDSESEMLGYGISIILLNIGMYFVAPAVLIMAVRKRISK
jgi:hypothetical protein